MTLTRVAIAFVIVVLVVSIAWANGGQSGINAETATPVAEEESEEVGETATPMAEEETEEVSETPTPVAEEEAEAVWWPSIWGADDEVGASNWISPEKVMAATQLIQEGTIYELGREYDAEMPLFGARVYALRIPGSPTGGLFGSNRLIYHDEYVSTEIGQVGTQFDGLGHIGIARGGLGDKSEMRFYNGITGLEMASANGLLKLGVENVKPIFTRGILIDVAGLKEGMLDAGVEITLADVLDALERQGMSEDDIQPGDVVLFNTGWGSLWKVDNARFNSGAPGIGLEVAAWLVERQVVLAGSDTWPVEVVPNPDPELAFPVHNELITKNGIYIHENLDFTELIEDEVYLFAYVYVRVPFTGATGSPGSPIAVR